MSLKPILLRDSFNLVIDREPQTIARFYEVLFERYPEAQSLFGRNAPQKQQQMLQETLVAALERLEDSTWLTTNLAALGRKHVDYGVSEEMYGWVGRAFWRRWPRSPVRIGRRSCRVRGRRRTPRSAT